MCCNINFLLNKRRVWLEIDSNDVKNFLCFKTQVHTKDLINTISVGENILLVCTCLPQEANGKPFWVDDPIEKNNIDAYDFNGNHLWNISEIVEKLHWYFYGGCIHSKTTLIQECSIPDNFELDGSHEFYVCTTEAKAFVIDINDKKVVLELPAK